MSLRDECRDILAEARGIAGSDDFELHPFRIYLRTTVSSGSHTGDGTLTESETELLENGSPPKVAKPGGQRAGGAGDVTMLSDDVVDSDIYVIGPITPVAGTAWATLTAASVNVGETLTVRIRHVEQATDVMARIVDVDDSSSLHVRITAVAVSPG